MLLRTVSTCDVLQITGRLIARALARAVDVTGSTSWVIAIWPLADDWLLKLALVPVSPVGLAMMQADGASPERTIRREASATAWAQAGADAIEPASAAISDSLQ